MAAWGSLSHVQLIEDGWKLVGGIVTLKTFFGHSVDSLLWNLRWVRRLSTRPRRSYRAEIINTLLAFAGPRAYLEIGLNFGRTFEEVEALSKTGVDPRPRFDLERLPQDTRVVVSTSDSYFDSLSSSNRFNLIFLDGLHEYQQTYRDFKNATRFLAEEGFIVIDDVVPVDFFSSFENQKTAVKMRRQKTGRRDRSWQGTVFRSLRAIDRVELNWDFFLVGPETSPVAVVFRTQETQSWPDGSDEILTSLNDYSYQDFLSWKREDPRLQPINIEELTTRLNTHESLRHGPAGEK